VDFFRTTVRDSSTTPFLTKTTVAGFSTAVDEFKTVGEGHFVALDRPKISVKRSSSAVFFTKTVVLFSSTIVGKSQTSLFMPVAVVHPPSNNLVITSNR